MAGKFKYAVGESVQAVVGDGYQDVTIIDRGTVKGDEVYRIEFSSGKRLVRKSSALISESDFVWESDKLQDSHTNEV